MKLYAFLAFALLAVIAQVFTLPLPSAESMEELLDLQTRDSSGADDEANMQQLSTVLQTVTSSNYTREEVDTVESFVKRLESNIENEELKEKHAYELIEKEKSVWIQRHKLKIDEVQKALEEERGLFNERGKSRDFLLKMIADIRIFMKALKQRDADFRNKTKEAEDDKKNETDKGKQKVGDEDHPALSCLQILQTGSADKDGVYWLDTDGGLHDNKFRAYCDMSNDGGGWTLLISLASAGLARAHVLATESGATADSTWPETFDISGGLEPATTGMYKGTLKPFTEVREEIASGKYQAFASNQTDASLDSIRSMYAYATKLTTAPSLRTRPDCRRSYSDHSPDQAMVACAPPSALDSLQSSLWVGWLLSPAGVSPCYFAAGEGADAAGLTGSAACPGKPRGDHWGKVWFR